MTFFHRNTAFNITDPLIDEEKQQVLNLFPKIDHPVQIMFRSDARIYKTTRKQSIVAMSCHFVKCFSQDKKKKLTEYASFHISDVLLIANKGTEFTVVQTKETNLTITAPECLRFAQILYRNCILSYNSLPATESVEMRPTYENQFPVIDVQLSPSQKFQFTYFSNCAKQGVPYNHEVVRYFHNLFLSKNSVVDLSQLPLNLASSPKDLIPIFDSVNLLKFVGGICCYDMNRPEAISTFSPLFTMGGNVHIIHFEKCGIKTGLNELLETVRKNPQLQVQYWDISNNQIQDITAFPEILSYSQLPVLYLNISNCAVNSQVSQNLFTTMTNNKNFLGIKYLFLGNTQISTPDATKAFDTFIKTITESKETYALESLDLNNSPSVEFIIDTIIKYSATLKTLKVNGCKFTQHCIDQLLTFIRSSTTLEVIDISGTSLQSEDVASVIQTIANNKNLDNFSLHMNNLKLSSGSFLPLYREFLRSDLSRWKALSFAQNGMSVDDLKDISPLFIRMTNLEELSIASNFSNPLTIDAVLIKLLRIPSLKKLDVSNCNLGTHLSPMLEKIPSKQTIESLDISGNNIGDNGASSICNVLHSSESVKELKLDNNNFTSIESINTVVMAAETNQYITSLNFPVNDAKKIVDGSKEHDKMISIKRLGDMQLSLVQRIMANRARLHMPNDLPFPATPDIRRLIKDISREAHSTYKGAALKRHSFTTDVFQLPMPFQNITDLLPDDDGVEEVPETAMTEYQTPSMFKYYNETNDDFKTMFTTMNPDITTFLTNAYNLNEQTEQKAEEVQEQPQPQQESTVERDVKVDSDYESEDSVDYALKTGFVKFSIRDDSDDEDYATRQMRKKTPKAPRLVRKQLEDDSDSDDEPKNVQRVPAPALKYKSKLIASESNMISSSAPPQKKSSAAAPPPKPKLMMQADVAADLDIPDEPKPKKSSSRKATPKSSDASPPLPPPQNSLSMHEEEEEYKPPTPKRQLPPPVETSSDDEPPPPPKPASKRQVPPPQESSDDEPPPPKPASKRQVPPPQESSDDEPRPPSKQPSKPSSKRESPPPPPQDSSSTMTDSENAMNLPAYKSPPPEPLPPKREHATPEMPDEDESERDWEREARRKLYPMEELMSFANSQLQEDKKGASPKKSPAKSPTKIPRRK